MKKIFTLIASIAVMTAMTLTAHADSHGFGDLVDLGTLELDTDYQLEGDFSDYIGTFTAPQSGTLIATGTNSKILEPYREKLSDMEKEGNRVGVTYDNYYGVKEYHFDVEEGTTYYFYSSFVDNDFTFRLTMNTSNSVEIKSLSPSVDERFSITGGGSVTIQFNRSVILDETALVIVGEKNVEVTVNGQGNLYAIDIKEPIYQWLTDGTLKGGDKFILRLTNIKASDDATIIYGTDGTADIEYTVNEMPTVLVSSENTTGAFKSYYMADDESRIVKLHFDNEIASASASLSFGSPEVEGDFYSEDIPTVIDGNTISVDLSGKLRTPDKMVQSGTNYNNMTITFSQIMDINNQYVFSASQGSIGSFSFTYESLEDITANVVSDFTPAPGTNLEGVESIEIWITDEAKLRYDGVLFAFSNDYEETQDLIVANDMITKVADEWDATASILTVPVPEVNDGAWKVAVSLHNLICADGLDHSADVYAEYYMGQSGIDKVFDENTSRYVVYNTQGILVLDTTHRNDLYNLPEGIYIINGKKFMMAR